MKQVLASRRHLLLHSVGRGKKQQQQYVLALRLKGQLERLSYEEVSISLVGGTGYGELSRRIRKAQTLESLRGFCKIKKRPFMLSLSG